MHIKQQIPVQVPPGGCENLYSTDQDFQNLSGNFSLFLTETQCFLNSGRQFAVEHLICLVRRQIETIEADVLLVNTHVKQSGLNVPSMTLRKCIDFTSLLNGEAPGSIATL